MREQIRVVVLSVVCIVKGRMVRWNGSRMVWLLSRLTLMHASGVTIRTYSRLFMYTYRNRSISCYVAAPRDRWCHERNWRSVYHLADGVVKFMLPILNERWDNTNYEYWSFIVRNLYLKLFFLSLWWNIFYLCEYFIIGMFIKMQENISSFFFLNLFLMLRIFYLKKIEKMFRKIYFLVRFLLLGETFFIFFRRPVYATNIKRTLGQYELRVLKSFIVRNLYLKLFFLSLWWNIFYVTWVFYYWNFYYTARKHFFIFLFEFIFNIKNFFI